MKSSYIKMAAALFSVCGSLANITAQSVQALPIQTAVFTNSKNEGEPRGRNLIKFNLAGVAARNYSLQYERVLNKRLALALSYRTMPSGNVPFKNKLLDLVAEDQDAKDALQNLQIGGSAITPEVRIYVGKKGYGQGFYFAPFYRYASFDASGVQVDFENLPGQTESIRFSGNSKSNTGGLLLGAQWLFGKSIALDWWILGPHYGSADAGLKGIPSKTLSSYEQQQLRNELEAMEFPLKNKEIIVAANEAQINLNGPWGGVRGGLSLGLRF